MSENWLDFNGVTVQNFSELIPNGHITKVLMNLEKGNYNEPEMGWTGYWATKNDRTQNVFLKFCCTILTGEYAGKRIWGKIGLRSVSGSAWGDMGRRFIKNVLISARGITQKMSSDDRKRLLKINSLGDLDGLIFVARIDLKKTQEGESRNFINIAIPPEHLRYAEIMAEKPSVQDPGECFETSLPAWAR